MILNNIPKSISPAKTAIAAVAGVVAVAVVVVRLNFCMN